MITEFKDVKGWTYRKVQLIDDITKWVQISPCGNIDTVYVRWGHIYLDGECMHPLEDDATWRHNLNLAWDCLDKLNALSTGVSMQMAQSARFDNQLLYLLVDRACLYIEDWCLDRHAAEAAICADVHHTWINVSNQLVTSNKE
jgi:hypothetical protein